MKGSSTSIPSPTKGICLTREPGDPDVGLPGDSGLVMGDCFLKRFLRSSLGIFDFRLIDPGELKRLVRESLFAVALSLRALQVEGGVGTIGVLARGDVLLGAGGKVRGDVGGV